MNNRERHSKRSAYNNSKANRQNNNQKSNIQHNNNYNNRFSNVKKFNPSKNAVSAEQIREEDEAIKVYKDSHQSVCPYCNKVVLDISAAMSAKGSEAIAHFDCVLEEVSKNEKLEAGDKIAYIGQGRFGVINYPNVHDVKHFTIKKIIDWEDKDNRLSWRNEMSELYSHVR
jgi:hypothetical protein